MERREAAIKHLNQLILDANDDDEAIAALARFVAADEEERREKNRKWGGSVLNRK